MYASCGFSPFHISHICQNKFPGKFCIPREESILQDINPEELHSKMQDPGFFEEAQLIDVREPEEV